MVDVTLNWTPLVDMLSGVPQIFTPIMAIMIAIVPLVLLGAVVGFITGLFDDLIDGVSGYLKPKRRG